MFGRRFPFPYVITSKIPGTPRASLALWPHILTLILIGLVSVIGLSMHETVPVEVQFGARTVVMVIDVLIATEWFGAP